MTQLVHLTINGEEIVTTDNHPFYVQGRGFIDAGNLLVGDKLISVNGEDLLIEDYRIELTEESVSVYNFQVEDYHTYFVGECCVWVHNDGCGGRYGDLKDDKSGRRYESEEVHHTPAKKSSKLPERDGPAIRMEKKDHRRTASCGRSKKAQEYRNKQAKLIEEGRFREAVQMDIDDIKKNFGDKYNEGIEDMLKYLDKLEKEGKI